MFHGANILLTLVCHRLIEAHRKSIVPFIPTFYGEKLQIYSHSSPDDRDVCNHTTQYAAQAMPLKSKRFYQCRHIITLREVELLRLSLKAYLNVRFWVESTVVYTRLHSVGTHQIFK